MSKIGLFFGTQTENTETIAETIQKAFGGDSVVTLHNVADADGKHSSSHANGELPPDGSAIGIARTR